MTPNDGTADGLTVCSNNVTILTTIPAISSVKNYSITNQSARINWSTNENGDSNVSYGVTVALGNSVVNTTLATGHDLALSGLTNNTVYYYNVTSCDEFDNCNTTGPFEFTTLQNTDEVQPALIEQQVQDITNSSAVINFTADESVNVTIAYGTTPETLSVFAFNDTFYTTRLMNISALINNTLYYYNITICDAFTNCNTTGPYSFSTLNNSFSLIVSPKLLSSFEIFKGAQNLTNGSLGLENTTLLMKTRLGARVVEFGANFEAGNVDLAGMRVNVSARKRMVFFNSSLNVGLNHTLFVPVVTYEGIYVCPQATDILGVNETCANVTRFSYAEALAGTMKVVAGTNVLVTINTTDYRVDGLEGSGAAEGTLVNLTIWDETDFGMPYADKTKQVGHNVTFFANFTNSTGQANATTGACRIDFNVPGYDEWDGYEDMLWDAGLALHIFNRTFPITGDFDWKANCTGAENLETTDVVSIVSVAPPSAPILIEPADGSTVFNPLLTFVWGNSTDPTRSPINYRLEISNVSDFSSNVYVNVTVNATEAQNTTSFLVTDPLAVDRTYFWRVLANNTLYSATSNTSNFTLPSMIALSLVRRGVYFGNLTPGTTLNTTNDSTTNPFVLRNDGNIPANVSITSTPLFLTADLNTSYVQYFVEDNETGSFQYAGSRTVWTNLSDSTSIGIYKLDWNNTHDQVAIHIMITMPNDEPLGNRTANVTMSGVA